MAEHVDDAFERFMYARAKLTEIEQVLRAARLTASRTFPLYAPGELAEIGAAITRYAKFAQRLARASEQLSAAVETASDGLGRPF